ncbi:MAG: hypothetical protein AAF337_09705 [Pseudomonadota bacterium]
MSLLVSLSLVTALLSAGSAPAEEAAPTSAQTAVQALAYESLVEPSDTSAATLKDMASNYEASKTGDTLKAYVAALLRAGEAGDAWDVVMAYPSSGPSPLFFKAKLETINANLAASGSLGKLKWARRLRAHCAAHVAAVPASEDALECLAKFHNRAPSMAGGDKAAGAQALASLRAANPARADMVEAEIVFGDNPEQARALVDAAMAHEDVYDPGLLQAAMVYGYFKDWDAAQTVLGRIPEGSSLSGMRHYQMGKLAAEHGEKLEMGERALLHFLSGQTRHLGVDFRGPAHWRLGQIFVHQERYELAEKAFKAALRYNRNLKPAKKDLKALKGRMAGRG